MLIFDKVNNIHELTIVNLEVCGSETSFCCHTKVPEGSLPVYMEDWWNTKFRVEVLMISTDYVNIGADFH